MYSNAIAYAVILICVTPHIFNVVHSHFHNVTTYCQPKEQILVGHRYNVRINVSYVDENGTYIENFTYVNETYSYHYNVGYFGPPVANISIPLNCTPCLPGRFLYYFSILFYFHFYYQLQSSLGTNRHSVCQTYWHAMW